eukprot:SAG31_NODE_6776_length_1892_cov_2.448410_3_plen_170_part_00
MNIITSNNMERGKLPVVCHNDRHTFEVSCRAAGVMDGALAATEEIVSHQAFAAHPVLVALFFAPVNQVRAVRIQNTLHVGECWSASAAKETVVTQCASFADVPSVCHVGLFVRARARVSSALLPELATQTQITVLEEGLDLFAPSGDLCLFGGTHADAAASVEKESAAM